MINRQTKSVKDRKSATPPQKHLQREKTAKPTSVPNILRVEIKEKNKDPLSHTKSTDYVDRKEWDFCDENYDGDDKSDSTTGLDELTPRAMEKLRGIAKLLLKQSPCSMPRPWENPSENIGGLKGKAITAKGLKCTEPLYHRMIEKNSLSDKDSLEVLHEMSPDVYVDRHLDNIEMLTRAIRLNDSEDNESSGDTVGRSDKKLLTQTLRKTVRKSAPKPGKNGSTSSVKVLKEMAVSLLKFAV